MCGLGICIGAGRVGVGEGICCLIAFHSFSVSLTPFISTPSFAVLCRVRLSSFSSPLLVFILISFFFRNPFSTIKCQNVFELAFLSVTDIHTGAIATENTGN